MMSSEEVVLSEDDIAELEAASPSSLCPAPIKKARGKDAKAMIDRVCENYPGLLDNHSHWSLALVQLMHKIKYEPIASLCSNRKDFGTRLVHEISHLQIVQKHLSDDLLNHIEQRLEAWVAENPHAIKIEGVKGAVIVECDSYTEVAETMSYQEGGSELEDAPSKTEEGWGSW